MNPWQKMIVDLRKVGLTQTQIANGMGCSQNYVSNLEKGLCGKRPGYEKGKKLKELWVEHCSTLKVA